MNTHHVPLRQSVEEIRLGNDSEEVGYDECDRSDGDEVLFMIMKR